MNYNDPEVMLVAGAIVSPQLAPEAAKYVDPSDFEDRKLGAVWRVVVGMLNEGASLEEIDAVAIARRATDDPEARNNLMAYLAKLLDVPRLTSLVVAAQRVHRRGTMRRAIEDMRAIATECKEQLKSPDGDVEDLDGRIARLSIDIAARSDVTNNRAEYQDLGSEVSAYFDQLAAGPAEGSIPTGLTRLDRKLGGGLRPGQLHVILGSTGSGKTALASQMCDEAVRRGKRAIMFSMEVDPVDVFIRDVERKAGVSRWKLRSFNEDRRQEAQEALLAAQMAIVTSGAGKIIYGEPMSVEGIRQAILTETMRGGPIDMIAVDHAQVAAPSASEKRNRPRYLEVKDVAEGLRAISKHLGVAVVLTGQLNPPPKGERPSKDMVRESKDIVNPAEVVMLIWHEKEEVDDETYITDSWIICDKTRAGSEGKVPVVYRGECYRFEDRGLSQNDDPEDD